MAQPNAFLQKTLDTPCVSSCMPSMGEFLYICEYLGVTPREFFDDSINDPQLVQELYELSRHLSEANLKILVDLAKRLSD